MAARPPRLPAVYRAITGKRSPSRMFALTAHSIRTATERDADALRRLAALDSRRVPEGRVLIGEIGGVPAAALSVDTGEVVADPFRGTARLVTSMRLRADGMRAFETAPTLPTRLLSRIPAPGGS